MTIDCPHCGANLGNLDVKPSTEQEVNPTRTQPLEPPPTTAPANPARWSFSAPDKSSEAGDAKHRFGEAITRADVAEVRRLYEGGMSLARIRQQLQLNVTLNRLQTVVNKPW